MYTLLIFVPKSELPDHDIFPHSYLPLHFWLDKGMVTRRVKKYPMLLRPAWLPRQIRNGSGNGGGVLVGYMPVVSHKRPLQNKFSQGLDLDRRPIRSNQPLCSTERGVRSLQTRSISKGFKEGVPKLEAAFEKW